MEKETFDKFDNAIIYNKRKGDYLNTMVDVQFKRLKKIYNSKFLFIENEYNNNLYYKYPEIIIIKAGEIVGKTKGFRQMNEFVELIDNI